MSISSHYKVTLIDSCDKKLKFHFQSIGKEKLPKAIEFELLPLGLRGKPVYNLGFGDHEQHHAEVIDTAVSNNGDVYKVFNTVLSTVPVFFQYHPEAAIHVRGSDGVEDYYNKCILHCTKACIIRCKKEGRRMAIYRSFVNKHYHQLRNDYVLFGGMDRTGSPYTHWEPYVADRLYHAILVYKRNTP